MAATNYTPIQLYYSTTASAAPVAGNLANGELAINITDGKLYYKDNSGTVQVIATKGAGTIGGSNTQIQYNNSGALAGNAAMTFNSATSTVTLTTLNLTNALGATYGGTAQSSYTQGDILYSSATNTLSKLGIGTVNYILTSTGSVPQWVAPTSVTVQTANNLAGGAAGSVPYQSAPDTTTFLSIGAANRVMTSSGTAPQWVTSLTGLTGVSSSSITNTSLTSGRVVYSTTGGAQTDDADLTFNGTTLSAGGYSTSGLSTLVKTVTIGNSNFDGSAVFAAATPAKLYIGTGTVTDTTSAIGATNAVGAISSLAVTPIAATNTSVTYTNASTLYIAGAPSAGTNVTITNPYSLYVAAGDAYFGGTVTAGTVNLTTLDLTNLEVTNIKAKDGTASITLADSTGVASFTANPVLSGGTANGVAYLSGGSKVLTTGSTLTTDGSSLTLSSGNLTIGSASSGKYLTVINGDAVNAQQIQLFMSGTDGVLQVTRAAGTTPNLLFWQDGSELARMTSTGFAIGTSSVITKLTVNGTDGITMQRSTANAFAPVLDYLKSRGTSASPAGVSDGDGLFLLRVAPYNGSAFTYLNSMTVEVDGGYTSGQNPPTRQIFYTNAANGSSTARLQILSNGYIGVGASPAYLFDINNVSTSGVSFAVRASGVTSSQVNIGIGVLTAGRPFIGTNTSSNPLEFGTRTNTDIVFVTDSTERGRFTSAGNFGIATNNPPELLSVVTSTNYAAAFNTYITTASSTRISIGALSTSGGGTGGSSAIGNDTNHGATAQSSLTFFTHDGSNLVERARFNPTGAFVFNGGTTTADGIGITFPATQVASSNANTLDDYEEGTWTPYLTVEGGSASIGANTVADARYTKIGRTVTVTCNASWSDYYANGGVSALRIVNLPFPVVTTNPGGIICGEGVWGSNNITGSPSTPFVFALTTGSVSTSDVYLMYTLAGANYSYLRVGGSPLASSSGTFTLNMTFQYQSAT